MAFAMEWAADQTYASKLLHKQEKLQTCMEKRETMTRMSILKGETNKARKIDPIQK